MAVQRSTLIVEAEVVFALAIDDMPNHDQRDLRDRALAPEGSEIEINHRADCAVTLPWGESEPTTESVCQPEFFEAMSPLTVAFHRGGTLLMKPAHALAQVVFGRVGTADTRRARRDQPPATHGFIALEVRPRDRTIPRALTERNTIGLLSKGGATLLDSWSW